MFIFALILLSLFSALQSEPAVSGAQARAFIGGRSGKVVYLDGSARQLFYIDFNDSVLTPRKIADDFNCISPMIHPNGNKIVYQSNASINIRPIAENTSIVHTVFTDITVGRSFEPRWWLDSATHLEYIIYNTGHWRDDQWPPSSGFTYTQQIAGSSNIENPNILLPFVMTGGRSKNGIWGATANGVTGMYLMYPYIENAFRQAYNWGVYPYIPACNPSISPSDSAHRQLRMMHLHGGLPKISSDSSLGNHEAIIIRDWMDPVGGENPLWYMGTPGIKCNNDSSGNIYWNYPEWSTDEHYFTVVGSKEIVNDVTSDLYIVRINYNGDNQILRILKGSYYAYPHLWIKDGELPAELQTDNLSIKFFAEVSDTIPPDSQIVQIWNSGDGLLPSLTCMDSTEWLNITIEENGTNRPRLIFSIDTIGLASGLYSASPLVFYEMGTDTLQFAVEFNVYHAKAVTLKVFPKSAFLKKEDSLQLNAIAYDQAGRPLPDLPEVMWSAAGPGVSISDEGLIIAVDSTGIHEIQGVAGDISCTTSVHLTSWLKRIDIGAAIDSATPGWESDELYIHSGSKVSVRGMGVKINNSGIDFPAPKVVYKTYRDNPETIVIPELSYGRYKVLLHFTNPVFSVNDTEQTIFDISINEKTLINDFIQSKDTVKEVQPETLEFDILISDKKETEFLFQTQSGSPAIHGVELFKVGQAPLLITSPSAGDMFYWGDTMKIKWTADENLVSGVGLIMQTPDTSFPINTIQSILPEHDDWGDYWWTIPDSLGPNPFLCDSCKLQIYDYFLNDITDFSDGYFSINSSVVPISAAPEGITRRFTVRKSYSGGISINIKTPGNYQIRITNINGRKFFSTIVKHTGIIDSGNLPAGLYFVEILFEGRSSMIRIPLL